MEALLLSLSLATSLVAASWPNPGPCTGNCIGIDPAAIRRSDGQYLRFNTFGKIQYYKAPSLAGPWTSQGAAIPAGSAPDVRKVGHRYILYYSVSMPNSQNSAIGYATSYTMEKGTWTDHGAVGISTMPGSNRNAIDSALFLDPSSGTYYMSFGSYWTGIWVVPMNAAATQVAKNAVYTNIARQPNGNGAFEGSFLVFRGGYYYLFFSAGDSGDFDPDNLPPAGQEYKIKVCRSKSVTGPYVGPVGGSCLNGNGLVLLGSHGDVYAPGGQGIFDDPKLGTVIYYHYGK
ncbi:hypothetical protein PFICI_04356 [Pestalotiopsis fici W106-1]|uniref:arabinan endo-1,5-alpha-L-arabinosidase n=1 Tax=Pestalotiopsis fici (strain W106-1 / CGMCC3.15140) TaxID=1229662 RepID=W3X8W4_PESFW|nr:uncharacterized protein PFICI_04356 [Pestalotiopsis fici W106-1]ETS82480.1 hypothetical protein PFICI_04356 [Pestalotiopsis fici W106-1]